MKIDNGILCLGLTNNGGEMAYLTYKGKDILYKGDGQYWSGKNPTLFPMISSPDTKKYTYDGKVYTCRNHGLIRYSTLTTVKEDSNLIQMRLESSEDTLKEYPFKFEYNITYRLDNNKVLIDYEIINKDDKTMPFTFGLHPGFIVSDLSKVELVFDNDDEGILYNQMDKSYSTIKLGHYTNFLADLDRTKTVILKDLKSDKVTLIEKDYKVSVSKKGYRYLGIWSADPNANFICIEPWLSNNDIKPSDNPFREDFELEYLKPNESFKIGYTIEVE